MSVLDISDTTVSSKHFTYIKKTKCLVAEVSDFPKSTDFCSRLYVDACDVGFGIMSEKTGQRVMFYFEKTDTQGNEDENEVTGWRFKITSESLRRFPHLEGLNVLIIND